MSLPNISESEIQYTIRLGHFGYGLVFIAATLFLILSAIIEISGAVIAEGTIVADQHRRKIQHRDGGVVSELRVRDGHSVTKGEVLAVVYDPQTNGALNSIRSQLLIEQVRAARAEAESRLEFDPKRSLIPGEDRLDDDAKEIVTKEKRTHELRTANLDAQISVIHGQRLEATRELEALKSQIRHLEFGVSAKREELAMHEELLSKQFIPRSRVLAIRSALGDNEAKLAEVRADLARVKQKILEISAKENFIKIGYKQNAIEEHRDSARRILEIKDRLNAMDEMVKRFEVVAPVDGIIVGQRVGSKGSVVMPGETLFELAPTDELLIAEARVRPNVIGDIRLNAQARLRLRANDQRMNPTLDGIVTFVAADAITTTEQNSPFFVVRVEVDESSKRRANIEKLTAGLPVEIYIDTEKRSILRYLMEPVANRLTHALREK